MDVSEVQAFLAGGTFYLATVFDAFSRTPLVLQCYAGKPGTAAMAKLLKAAVRAFGKANYVITDQEFKGNIFSKTAARLGIIHRYGTKDRIFATARLQKFWRTLEQAAKLKLDPPLTIEDMERRLEVAPHPLPLCPAAPGTPGGDASGGVPRTRVAVPERRVAAASSTG